MRLLKVVKSRNPEKKWTAVFEKDGKQKMVSFGSANMTDYTLGATEEQKEAYRRRHKKDLDTGDPTRPGYLSWYILWNKRSRNASILDYKNIFNL